MKPTIYLFCLTIFLGLLECQSQDIQALFTEKTIILDGDLTEDVWKEAPIYHNFEVYPSGNQKATRRTEYQILFNPTAFVIGIRAFIPHDQLLSPEKLSKKINPYHSDSIELMIDCNQTGDYLHFIIDSINTRFQEYREQGGYVTSSDLRDFNWASGVRRHRDCWTAEISIPYSELDLYPRTDHRKYHWNINIVRNTYWQPHNNMEISSIAHGKVNSSQAFLKIAAYEKFLHPYLFSFHSPTIQTKLNQGALDFIASCRLENFTGRPCKLKTDMILSGPDEKFFLDSKVLPSVFPGHDLEFTFKKQHLLKTGKYKGMIIIRDAEYNHILRRCHFSYEASFIPVEILVQDPCYRNAIFATQKIDQVRYSILCHDPALITHSYKILSGIRRHKNGNILVERTVPITKNLEFTYDAKNLPVEEMEIFAIILDSRKKKIFEFCVPLYKLPYQKNEVFRDKSGNWYVDGKKIFILASWGTEEESFLPEYNVVLDYRHHKGKKYIISRNLMFGASDIMQTLRKNGATPEVVRGLTNALDKCKNNSRVFAHYLCDEPDCFGFSADVLKEIYPALVKADLYHPILISTAGTGEAYLGCSELNGMHAYPDPIIGKSYSGFKKIVNRMDKYRDFIKKSSQIQDIIYLHQGFNYGDFGAYNNRIPSFNELRNQNLMVLVLGARGIFNYNRTEKQYPELYLGLPEMLKELKLVGEQAVIHETTPEKATSANSSLRILSKCNDKGYYWFLVSNISNQEIHSSFKFKAAAGMTFTVLSENRTVTADAEGIIKDHFAPWQVNVYTNQPDLPELKSLPEINAAIEHEYQKLHKKGNLAWQRFEGDVLKVSASSNKFSGNYEDSTLWHLTDGFTSGELATSRHGYGILHFCDRTANSYPDWIEYKFKKVQKIGRVDFYPIQDSVRDFKIQVLKNNKFSTVKTVENFSGKLASVKFSPVETDCLRLVVTAGRGKYTKIYEMEVYSD